LELIIFLRRKVVIVFISIGKVMHSKVVRKIKPIKLKSRGCKEEKEMQIKN
jgi:hypothetical protein